MQIQAILFLSCCVAQATSFVSPTCQTLGRKRSKNKLSLSSGSKKEDEIGEEKRMELVRSLQSAYYQSSGRSSPIRPALNETTGIMQNLPLWRVQWTELPGRSNVLNVHEGMYTNMFEVILNGPKPWYFGHLFLPEGSKNIKSADYCFQLKTWYDELKDMTRASQPTRSAAVGTLMRITDVRRLTDGRLILLVQALERFVIDDVLQTLPYAIANVQIVPDLDLLPSGATEEQSKGLRTKAVLQSMQYHDYEYEDTRLPLADTEYLHVTDVFGAAVRAVIPFVPISADDSSLQAMQEQNDGASPTFGVEISMESRLTDGNILCNPPNHPNMDNRNDDASLDTLETLVWIALEDFCQSTCRQGYVPAEQLLHLRPPGLASRFPETRRPSPLYPALRRQRRLSFAAAGMLEGSKIGSDLRHVWLQTPTTKARLHAVLERFEIANRMMMGEFQ